MYEPHWFTHQGISGHSHGKIPENPITYPEKYVSPTATLTFDRTQLVQALQPVREFQIKYHVPIFVGEFSAVCDAPGAVHYLSDCIDLFEQYGWNWTYHAFRESPLWSVEHQSRLGGKRMNTTDRKELLLRWYARNRPQPN